MLHFLIYDVLGTPAILVGLFSLIGLLLQKRNFRRYLRHPENHHGFCYFNGWRRYHCLYINHF